MLQAEYQGIKFTDADVVDVGNYDRDVKGFVKKRSYDYVPWLIHDAGFVLAVVFAQNEQDALDEAVDADKLDHFMIDPTDKGERADYMVKDVVPPGHDPTYPEYIDPDGGKWWWREGREPTCLGNAGEPFDIENVGIVQLPNPPFSFVALFNAATAEAKV